MADIEDELGQSPEIPKGPLALATRIALVERDTRAHARSITSLVEHDNQQSTRLDNLEKWQLDRLLVEAREEEREKHLHERLERMETLFKDGLKLVGDEVRGIKGNFGKVFWIAMGTIIPAVILGVALILVFGIKVIPN